jgi:hypothetical protein
VIPSDAVGRARDDLSGSEPSGVRGHRTTTDAACILPESPKEMRTDDQPPVV